MAASKRLIVSEDLITSIMVSGFACCGFAARVQGWCLKGKTEGLTPRDEFAGPVVDESALLVSTLEASQQQHLATLLGLAEDMKYYVELLSSFLEQQARFVSEAKLKAQKVGRSNDLPKSACLLQTVVFWFCKIMSQLTCHFLLQETQKGSLGAFSQGAEIVMLSSLSVFVLL